MIDANIALTNLNTFHLRASAKYFATFSSHEQLQEILEYAGKNAVMKQSKMFILGGGSNILFTKDYNGLVLKNEIVGVDVVREDADHVYVKVGGGENWHSFVMDCINRGLAGIENLSLIPGNVGASPMQNIGAYGVEVKEVFESLSAYHLKDKKVVSFSLNDCAFGYRESVFKNKYKDQFVILDVVYRLNKHPHFNTSYGAIEQELERMGVEELSISHISKAVINIRRSKLPDPEVIGNAGSFFKNPVIKKLALDKIKNDYPNIPSYVADEHHVKVPAAWLIEQCGWKGYRRGDAGCHDRQALVLVNYGNAKGSEIYELSEEILQSVQNKFGIILEREVNIV